MIGKLQLFLLELGKGFAFMGRQQRITLDGEHFFIDLVFYNRLTRSFVLLDLKVGKLTHQDLGQMQMYVNDYQRELTAPDENPPIGIVLCTDKSEAVVRYALPEGNSQIFASHGKASCARCHCGRAWLLEVIRPVEANNAPGSRSLLNQFLGKPAASARRWSKLRSSSAQRMFRWRTTPSASMTKAVG